MVVAMRFPQTRVGVVETKRGNSKQGKESSSESAPDFKSADSTKMRCESCAGCKSRTRHHPAV